MLLRKDDCKVSDEDRNSLLVHGMDKNPFMIEYSYTRLKYPCSAGEELRQFATVFGNDEVEQDAEGHIAHHSPPTSVCIEDGERVFRLTSGNLFEAHAQWLS